MNFDKQINRYGTYSTQWGYTKDRFGSSEVLPFSISDTDFPVPKSVIKALEKRLQHPIFGYTRWNHDDYKHSIINWYKNKNCEVKAGYISYSPSVMFSVAAFIRMKSNEGDGVVIFTPMYDAFFGIIESNNRKMVKVPIGNAYNNYEMNWTLLEEKLSNPNNKIMILTNPHNPTGKVFTKEEIKKIVNLCEKHDVFLISDDIHMDIIYDNNEYYPVINELTSENKAQMVVCTSSSKTFNTPGLIGSYLLIPDENNFVEFQKVLKQQNGLSSASIFGMISQMAAYNDKEYVIELVKYIDENMKLLEKFCSENAELGLEFKKSQGTYLAWIKITSAKSEEEIEELLINKGKVGIMSGSTYDGDGYLRMNLACPRKKVEEGLKRIKQALS